MILVKKKNFILLPITGLLTLEEIRQLKDDIRGIPKTDAEVAKDKELAREFGLKRENYYIDQHNGMGGALFGEFILLQVIAYIENKVNKVENGSKLTYEQWHVDNTDTPTPAKFYSVGDGSITQGLTSECRDNVR
jgi:hypothetical protein